MASERQPNRYEAPCCDCGAMVPPLEGRLYRLFGANLSGKFRKAKVSRYTGVAYAVRCDDCYRTHDKIVDEPRSSYGIDYSRGHAAALEAN